jgi:hypothetical protein
MFSGMYVFEFRFQQISEQDSSALDRLSCMPSGLNLLVGETYEIQDHPSRISFNPFLRKLLLQDCFHFR